MSNSEMPGRKKLLAWQVPLVITCLSLLAISLLVIVFSIKVYMIVSILAFTLALKNVLFLVHSNFKPRKSGRGAEEVVGLIDLGALNGKTRRER